MPQRLRAVLVASALMSGVALQDAYALDAGAAGASARVGPLFGDGPGGGHFCTASVVHSPGRNLIVTAAHCLAEGDEVSFAPGYRDGRAPYGLWEVERVFADAAWRDGEDEDHDLAFATVRPREGRRVQDVTGASALATDGRTGRETTLTGYNSAEDRPRSCTAVPTAFHGTQQRIACPGFSTGTSGSPWVDARGRITGVLGGYRDGGDSPDVSYSVLLDGRAAALYREATRMP